MIVPVIVKLGKYIVPDLHIAVTVAAYPTVCLAAAICLPAVIVHLGARSAGTGAMLPEVVLFSKPEDSLRRNPNLLIPDLPRLVILQIHRRIQPVRVKTYNLCQKFPCPVDGFPLKIISKGEVSKHLKKRTVPRCLPHVLNIPCADALLAGGNPPLRGNLLSSKIRLQRRHPRINQQQTLIVMRHQRKAFHF